MCWTKVQRFTLRNSPVHERIYTIRNPEFMEWFQKLLDGEIV